MSQPVSYAASQPLSATDRTKLRRHRERGVADRAALHALLDECFVVHVSTPDPRMLPMALGRIGDRLYLHGAAAHGLLGRALALGQEVCVGATAVDGLVLARSAMHHSMNYRAAVIHGRLEEVQGDEKVDALRAILEHTVPGRQAECRPPAAAELRATLVVALDLSEASVKVRTGPPKDDAEDLSLDAWAGVLPVSRAVQAMVPDVAFDADPPPSLVATALAHAPRLDGDRRHGEVVLSFDPRALRFETLFGWLRQADESTDLSRARLLRSLLHAYVVGAYDVAGEQVGFARLVTDGETFGWLTDVYVAPAARGRGLGTELARALVEHQRFARVRRMVLATKDARPVYAKLGFEPAPAECFMQRS